VVMNLTERVWPAKLYLGHKGFNGLPPRLIVWKLIPCFRKNRVTNVEEPGKCMVVEESRNTVSSPGRPQSRVDVDAHFTCLTCLSCIRHFSYWHLSSLLVVSDVVTLHVYIVCCERGILTIFFPAHMSRYCLYI
jgi:hypothetical protein